METPHIHKATMQLGEKWQHAESMVNERKMMAKKIKLTTTETEEFVKDVLSWFLDLPIHNALREDGGDLCLRGWLLTRKEGSEIHLLLESEGATTRHRLDVPRLDVIDAVLYSTSLVHPQLMCGFELSIPYVDRPIRLGFEIDGTQHFVRTLRTVESASVLMGARDWMFLDNDTNRSVDQYRGSLLISDVELAQWDEYFEAAHVQLLECKKWTFLIAPSKEYVYPDYFPHEAGECSPTTQLLDLCQLKGVPVIYPLTALTAERELTYPRGDTHWTDYGAFVASEQIRASFDIDPLPLGKLPPFHLVRRFGDLGDKLEPPEPHNEFVADFTAIGSTLVMDSGIHNHGRIWIFENQAPSTTMTAVLFGSSSSINMSRWLSLYFRRLVYIHTAGGIDPVVLGMEKPDCVIIQTNDRFVVSAPPASVSVKEVIAEKVQSMSTHDREILDSRMQAQEDSPYIAWVTEAIESQR